MHTCTPFNISYLPWHLPINHIMCVEEQGLSTNLQSQKPYNENFLLLCSANNYLGLNFCVLSNIFMGTGHA